MRRLPACALAFAWAATSVGALVTDAAAQQRTSTFEERLVFNYEGADQLEFLSKPRPEQCRDACLANAQCKYWTWRVSDARYETNCALIAKVLKVVPGDGGAGNYGGRIIVAATSPGGRTSTIEPGTLLKIYDERTVVFGRYPNEVRTTTAEQCRDRCIATARCNFWDWRGPDTAGPNLCVGYTRHDGKTRHEGNYASGAVSARGAATPRQRDATEAQLLQHCLNVHLTDAALIHNCTAMIDSGRLDRDQLADALNARGVAYRASDPNRAIADLLRAIELSPKVYMANLGGVYEYSFGDFARAAQYYGEALARAPIADKTMSQISRGRALLLDGRFDAAIADFNAILMRNSANAGALYLRGIAKRRKGDASGDADLAAAVPRLDPRVRASFERAGLTP